MRSRSKKQTLLEFIAARQITAIGAAEWNAALQSLAPISESYLRRLLHNTGLPFAQPWAGIRQNSFQVLEQDLLAMLLVYQEAVRAGDRRLMRDCRRQVIAAKDRARFHAEKHPEKPEMIQWMLVWLENPEVFPAWVEIRKR
jgi:hypothetical protein